MGKLGLTWKCGKKSQDENADKMKTTKIREPKFQNANPLWSRIPAQELKSAMDLARRDG